MVAEQNDPTSETLADFFNLSPSSLAAIERALAGQTREGIPQELTLTNGVVLKLKATPPFIFEDALKEMPLPSPPLFLNPTNNLMEENPLDPDYHDALEDYTRQRLRVVFRIAVLSGTELLSVPDNMPRPEDEEWAERALLIKPTLEIPPPERKAARYFAWLRYVALEKVEDIALITGLPLILAGIGEAEVSAAMASFRSNEARRTD